MLLGNVFFRHAAVEKDTSDVTPGFMACVNVSVGDELASLPLHVAGGLRVGFGQYLSGTCVKNNALYGGPSAEPCDGLDGFYGDDSDLEFASVSGRPSVLTATFYAPSQAQADRNAGLFASLMPAGPALLRFLLSTGAAGLQSYKLAET
jgi:hypothetical protein